jgi:pilus assembly protein CpaF
MRPPSLLAPPEAVERAASSAVPPLPSRAPEPLPDDALPAVLRGERPSVPPPLNSPSLPPALSSSSVPPKISSAPPRTLPSMPPVIGGPEVLGERPLGEQTNVAPYPQDDPPEPGLLAILPAPVTNGREVASAGPGNHVRELTLLMLGVARDFDVENVDPAARADERRWQKAERVVQAKLTDLVNEGQLRASERSKLAKAALHEALGLGPLDPLLADPQVCHVVVEHFDRVCADRGHGLIQEDCSFSSAQAVHTVVRRLSAEAGLTGGLPESIDVSLPNGLHLVAMLKGAASEGPVVSLRRRPTQLVRLAELRERGRLDETQERCIHEALAQRQHVWLVGPSGGELASTLSALLADCAETERLALFERSPEIALGERSAICLRLGSVGLEQMLARVRYFRPDRVVLHEPSESELATVLQTFGRRQDGSLASLEQKSAKDALGVLERCAGADLVLRAVSLIVELTRTPEGARVQGVYRPELDAAGALVLRAAT